MINSIRNMMNRLKSFGLKKYLTTRYKQISISDNFQTKGKLPIIFADSRSRISIGKGVVFNNSSRYNSLGLYKECTIKAVHGGEINIGDNVGLSGVSISSIQQVVIKKNVFIGANSMIFDSDAHSLYYSDRILEITKGKRTNIKSAPILIEEGVFIGANSIIVKGVIIGKASIVAAGSIVVKSIPQSEIWGGNPAKFLAKIESRDE